MNIDIKCGDCFDHLSSIPDGSVDLLLTDPPYGHNNNDGDLISKREAALGKGPAGEARPILNDGPEANIIVQNLFREAKRVLKPGGCCCCCCCGGGPDPQFARWSLWLDEVLQFKQMVIWDKGKMGMGWHYRRSYETVLVAYKKGAKCKWYDTSHRIENVIRPGDYGIKKIVPSKDQHPTQKPVALMELFIRLHTLPGDTVLDPFMGSGTTGVAAKLNGRNFIGFEMDEHFFEVATRRIADALEPPLNPIQGVISGTPLKPDSGAQGLIRFETLTNIE